MRSLVITQNLTFDGAAGMLDDGFEPATQADRDKGPGRETNAARVDVELARGLDCGA